MTHPLIEEKVKEFEERFRRKYAGFYDSRGEFIETTSGRDNATVHFLRTALTETFQAGEREMLEKVIQTADSLIMRDGDEETRFAYNSGNRAIRDHLKLFGTKITLSPKEE